MTKLENGKIKTESEQRRISRIRKSLRISINQDYSDGRKNPKSRNGLVCKECKKPIRLGSRRLHKYLHQKCWEKLYGKI